MAAPRTKLTALDGMTSPTAPAQASSTHALRRGHRACAFGVCASSLVLLGLANGCSTLLEVEPVQCEADIDCERLGGQFTGTSCVEGLCISPDEGAGGNGGAASSPFECVDPEPVEGDSITYTFTIKYATPPSEPVPSTMKACERLDALCKAPVAVAENIVAGELVDLQLPIGFAGYFQIENPLTLSALHFLGRPLLEDTRGWDLTIADDVTVAGLGLATGTEIDPEQGAIIVIARDCDALPLESATFSNSAGGVQFYIVNNFPTPQATATTEQGSGGFVNVPIGTTILSASHESGAELTATSAVIRALGEGWVSYVELFP